MKKLELYTIVRVRKLIQAEHEYDGWRFNKQPPKIGDTGTLIDVLTALGFPNKYVVESSLDGETIWLADFYAEEIESN